MHPAYIFCQTIYTLRCITTAAAIILTRFYPKNQRLIMNPDRQMANNTIGRPRKTNRDTKRMYDFNMRRAEAVEWEMGRWAVKILCTRPTAPTGEKRGGVTAPTKRSSRGGGTRFPQKRWTGEGQLPLLQHRSRGPASLKRGRMAAGSQGVGAGAPDVGGVWHMGEGQGLDPPPRWAPGVEGPGVSVKGPGTVL